MITILIPTYNRPLDFKNALSSLYIQTYKNFKVVVVDDCSTKTNLKQIENICNEFPNLNITLLKNKTHLGCGGNRQIGYEYIKEHPTKYLMFLDSDDMYYPQTVERLFNCAETNNADIVSSNILSYIADNWHENIIEAERSKTWLHGKIYSLDFLIKNEVNFNKNLETNEDLNFNLIAFAKTKNTFLLKEILYLWKNNKDSITHSTDSIYQQHKCGSIDYIEALYQAWLCAKDSVIIKANILNLYNFYQIGVAYKLITKEIDEHIYELLHDEDIMDAVVNIYKIDTDQTFKQWIKDGDNLLFFGQTFGQWLMKYYTREEILAAIKRSKEKDDKEWSS